MEIPIKSDNTRTLRVVTLWFCTLFGIMWLYISYEMTAMYVPPSEIQIFLIGLLTGKWAQSYTERPKAGA